MQAAATSISNNDSSCYGVTAFVFPPRGVAYVAKLFPLRVQGEGNSPLVSMPVHHALTVPVHTRNSQPKSLASSKL